MSTFEALGSAADFLGGYYVDWFDAPDGPRAAGSGYTAGNCRYDFGDIEIVIAVDGPPVSLSICAPTNVRGQFRRGDSVLLADCHPNFKPLRLLFDPPVSAVGTQVGAIGMAGQAYDSVLYAAGADGEAQGRSVRATLRNVVGNAPFVGLRCRDGACITEAWFDVLSPDGAGSFSQVAINQLYFVP
ncbi:MAG: hypothetical protein QM674_11570 [Burkholderiaceae bacterium]